jgi:hypothetical protein
MTVYRQSANPNATNSELDAKEIVHHVTFDDYQFAEDDSPENVLTDAQRDEVIEQYIDIVIDNMDTKTMIQVITDFLKDEYNDYSDEELKCQIECTHDEELYKELVDNVTNETVLDVNNTGGKY